MRSLHSTHGEIHEAFYGDGHCRAADPGLHYRATAVKGSRGTALALLLAVAPLGAAHGQRHLPQPQLYLLTTDVADGRALWLQPAALIRRPEASVAAMVTADRRRGGVVLAQYGATLHAGPLGLGWQRDRADSGLHADAFALGLALGGPLGSLGASRSWHRGADTHRSSWDLGGRYALGPRLELGAVWRDIGSPVILGDTVRATLVPGAGLTLIPNTMNLAAEWEIVTNGWATSAIRGSVAVALPLRLAVSLRADLSGGMSLRGVAAAVTWHRDGGRVAAFAAGARSPEADRAGAWASLVSVPQAPRRRP